MKRASASTRALPLACVAVTFLSSLVLFLTRNQRAIGSFPSLLRNYRNTAQVIVQVLSSILSLAQMLVITSLINFSARIELFKSPTTIGRLSFWSALSVSRFDRTLPSVKLAFVTLLLALGTVLGALWAGSLTPLSVTVPRDDGSVLVPCFNTTLGAPIYAHSKTGHIVVQCNNNETADPRGSSYPLLDNCIVMNKLGSLIMTAATATNVTSPKLHSKIDNSTWTYKGRSYGKGSLAGLFDVSNATLKPNDIGFSFHESGYNTQASCQRQNYSVLPFQQEDSSTGAGQFNLWSADTVVLDSGNVTIPPFYLASPTFNDINSRVFGYFAWSAFTTQDHVHHLATSSQNGSWSQSPDRLLCTIDFVPWTFKVNVSKTEQSITVTPISKIEDFNQTGGNIADVIVRELDLMSRMSSSSVAFSSLFNAIQSNYHAAQLAYANLTAADDDTVWEHALRDAITEVADDLLTYHGILAVSSGAPGDRTPQPAQRHFPAVKVGQQPYQIAQLAINAVLAAVCLYEVRRTRFWRQLPEFDFLDTKALVVAALGPPGPPAERAGGQKSTGDRAEVLALYDEHARARLVFSDGAGEARRLVSRAESSSSPPYPLDDLGPQRDQRSTAHDRDGVRFPFRSLLSPNEEYRAI